MNNDTTETLPLDPSTADATLVLFGDAVKAMGDGKIGGLLAPFGSPSDTDSARDYFSPATDFGLDVTDRARVMFHHGFTKAFGRKKLGVVGMGIDPALGLVAVEPLQLDMADEVHRKVYEDATKGKLYWSTGTSPHLMERRQVGSARMVTAWPVVEASLTYNPVNRGAVAMALKSLLDDPDSSELSPATPDDIPAAGTLAGDLKRLAADARRLCALATKAFDQRRSEGRNPSVEKCEAIKALLPDLRELIGAFEPLSVALPDAPAAPAVDAARLAKIDHLLRLQRLAALEAPPR